MNRRGPGLPAGYIYTYESISLLDEPRPDQGKRGAYQGLLTSLASALHQSGGEAGQDAPCLRADRLPCANTYLESQSKRYTRGSSDVLVRPKYMSVVLIDTRVTDLSCLLAL
jgi:hypothetical protein